MKIQISSKTSIYDLVKTYPDIKEIMACLGFVDILKPGMLQSAGRIMTLQIGSKYKKIGWESIVNEFEKHGYELRK